MRRLLLTLAFAMTLLAPSFAAAQAHVPLPPVNLGGSSFLDAAGGPGFVFQEIVGGTRATRFVDHKGNTMPGPFGVSAFTTLTQAAYVVPTKIAGVWWGIEALLPVAHVELTTPGGRSTTTGVGDLTFSPLVIQVPEHRIFGRPIFQRFDLDLVAPTGSYDRSAAVNVGSNVWSINPYYSVTVLPTERIETSLRLHYLWSSPNHEPTAQYGDVGTIQSGQAVHLNAATSAAIAGGFRAGVAGYFLTQITPDRVGTKEVLNGRERVLGLGPGVFWGMGTMRVLANVYAETAVENRAPSGRFSTSFLSVW